MRRIYTVVLLILSFMPARAQYRFSENDLHEEISILNYASLLNTGATELSLDQIMNDNGQLHFNPLKGKYGHLGFTTDHYWVKFQLKNTLGTPVLYYLQTAEPVTDNVDLYLIGKNKRIEIQRSGDNLDFSHRSVKNRSTFFKIELAPGEMKSAYIAIRNDGEKNSLPLLLSSQQRLLDITYKDQLIMGIFYGILAVISITYFFFYFALNELSFFYYSMYVVFMGLCQFALDGFYHQYIGTGNSWLSLHAVIISALLSCFFFGKYSMIILNIKEKSPALYKMFNPLYLMLGLTLAGVILVPGFLKYSYPLTNVLTLFGIILIFLSVIVIIYKRQQIDTFYTIGIAVLFLSIIMAILMNFGVFPEDFFTDNITKLGIGLEIIALSLSMANRIRVLKSKEQKFQAIALQKSEEMNDVKSYFLSNMSHELRTPLNAILGLAAMMEKESNDPSVKANCEIIRHTSHELMSSVHDILDFSEIEKGELKLDSLDFKPAAIITKIAQRTKQRCENQGLSFNFANSLKEQTTIIGDPVRLEQIIHNVISNALKFTEKGQIGFEVKAIYEESVLNLTILITDTGVGIASQKLETVFNLFSQSNIDNKRRYGGFGIGLTIVKALTDLHGGKISMQSEPGSGTSCEIQLSYVLQPVEEILPGRYPMDDFDLLGSHVLIVEDNLMNQKIIQMMMRSWKNTTTHIANNGLECLEIMNRQQMDVVLMDLQMPVMDGYEAIAAIKNGDAGERSRQIPIIVITADVMSASKERVSGMGITDYMNKPIDKDQLYQKITTALSRVERAEVRVC